jgi:hypothetical protein
VVLLNGMLKDHMSTNNVLVPEECGLRTGMSTNDAVIELTQRILKSVNKKKHHHGKVWGSGGIAPLILNFDSRWR